MHHPNHNTITHRKPVDLPKEAIYARNMASTKPPLRVVFIHLDWGIGGAEQLMLQLCTATKQMESSSNSIDMHLVTSYCHPEHCFELLKRPSTNSDQTNHNNNNYYQYLKIYGAWIPSHILFSKGKALMSTLRLLYIAFRVIHHPVMSNADLIVLDVLPTPLWIFHYFCPKASLLFYCHFPDQLLTRTAVGTHPPPASFVRKLIQGYRTLLNTLEEQCMIYADTITVNSKFTQHTVRETFTSLSSIDLPILYPALEIPPDTSSIQYGSKRTNLIVSLNRFERKKNLGLLIEAMAWIQQQGPAKNRLKGVQVIIAGGYDPKNMENIEYRIELQQLAERLHVQDMIDFRHSISDTERNELLHQATMVVYTPSHEHFGIVPLEAMYAHTPVVACHNGGPVETIVHGRTGFLCAPTPDSFGTAIDTFLSNPQQAIQMGRNGHEHVIQQFSPQHLRTQWEQLVIQTLHRGAERRQRQQKGWMLTPRTLLYATESILTIFSLYIGLFYLILPLWMELRGLVGRNDHIDEL